MTGSQIGSSIDIRRGSIGRRSHPIFDHCPMFADESESDSPVVRSIASNTLLHLGMALPSS